MKVYTCTSFKGFWPVGAAAVVVAYDNYEAARYLNQKLQSIGLVGDVLETQMEELVLEEGTVEVLCDGDY